ncbi:MAG: cytochrome P450 [Myxococcaceae bacterium]
METLDFHAAKEPTGPKAESLLLGHLPEIRRNPLQFILRTGREYPGIAKLRMGTLRAHLISDPEAVKRVLQDHVQNYTKDHLSYTFMRYVLGNGLLTSQGTFWLRQRRLAQPAFHRQRIAGMAKVMTDGATDLVRRWSEDPNEPRDIVEEMMQLTVQVASNALFGTGVERSQIDRVSSSFNVLSAQLVERFRTFRLVPPVLPTKYDREFRTAHRTLNEVVREIVAAKRAHFEDTGDLLSMLMLAKDEDTGEQMTDEQLRSEVTTMLLAGHETTATALSWLWAMLEQNPEAERKLHAELAQVLGGRTPTFEDVPKLAYTKMVIEETMRLYPPVYVLSRQVKEDDVLCGFRIRKGSAVDLSPYLMHRLPQYWDAPDEFRPDRFTSEEQAKRPRFLYMPFLGGPRQCIGNNFAMMEAQLVVATIAQQFAPRTLDGKVPEADPLVTLRPRGGLHMRPLTRRSEVRAA